MATASVDTWKPNDGDVVTLLRHPQTANPTNPLGRTSLVLPGRVSSRKLLLLSVLSKDSRGIAAHVADLCARRGVKIAKCFGAKALTGQGSFFEVVAGDGHEDALVQLQPELDRDDTAFGSLPPLVPDRMFELKVKVHEREDGHDEDDVALEILLRDLFTLLAKSGVNLTRFDAQSADAELSLGLLAEAAADLETPKGVDVKSLHYQLRDKCPRRTEVAMHELYARSEPYSAVLYKD